MAGVAADDEKKLFSLVAVVVSPGLLAVEDGCSAC